MSERQPTIKPKRARDAAWTITTYLGEGLPWSVLHQMATEFLTARRVSETQVGYTSALHLAVTLKFLWSPFVDLISTKRRWLLAMQLVLGLLLFWIALTTASTTLTLFWLLLVAFSIFHATHDIACDGFYLLGHGSQQQALYSGLRVAAFRAAMILGGGGLVYVAGQSSWLYAFGLAGVTMIGLAVTNGILMPHPQERDESGVSSKLTPTTFLEAYRSFFTQPKVVVVLSFIFLFRIGDIMMFAMAKPLLRDLGIDLSMRGVLTGVGTAVTIIGSLFGGALIAKQGLKKWLIPIAFFQNFAILLYFILALNWVGPVGIVLIVVAEQFAAGVGNAAHTVFLMKRCRNAFSASHYAFATAVVALASTLAGTASGHLYKYLGAPKYFLFAFLISIPSLLLVFLVPKDEA